MPYHNKHYYALYNSSGIGFTYGSSRCSAKTPWLLPAFTEREWVDCNAEGNDSSCTAEKTQIGMYQVCSGPSRKVSGSMVRVVRYLTIDIAQACGLGAEPDAVKRWLSNIQQHWLLIIYYYSSTHTAEACLCIKVRTRKEHLPHSSWRPLERKSSRSISASMQSQPFAWIVQWGLRVVTASVNRASIAHAH